MQSRRSLQSFAYLIVLAMLVVMTMPATLVAAPNFPRGPGFYYDPFKLVALVAALLGWIKLCAWVDADAHKLNISAVRWNGILLAVGVGSFLVLWNLAIFWLILIVASAGICGAAYGYIRVRNRRAPAEERLFDKAHFQRLYQQYFGPKDKSTEGKAGAKKPEGHPIRFLTRSTSGAGEPDDKERVTRVQQSKGYKAALDMVWDALQKRATDIHLEPTNTEVVIRFRVDGIMTNITPMSRLQGDAVINIFKVLSNLDITEKRKSQDGSFSSQVEDRIVEFRIATAGSVVGEKMVMRVLDASAQLADLSQVGLTESLQAQVREVITKPHGLFLVCGPTGSGKSTTLYACLHEIDRFQQNIITVENPVEYRLDGITQIEVSAKTGKTFATELRSILRQDPDVILVGEIRDKETAEIACQAAQTGHLVLSTVHANDAVGAIARMVDLGVPPFMLSQALMAVLGQRLVRRLCRKCRKRMKPSADTLKKLKIDADAVRYIYRAYDPVEDAPKKKDEDDEDEKPAPKKKKGAPVAADEEEEQPAACEACGGTGFVRRTGIFDLLLVTDKIRELIRENPNMNEIRRIAIEGGMKSLFEDGTRLVIDGETSIQELLRVAK